MEWAVDGIAMEEDKRRCALEMDSEKAEWNEVVSM